MMNKEVLYEILNSESEKLSSAEIENILNEELDKSPEEMDTDLVDLCLDALNRADEAQVNKKRHRISLAKILVAAVLCMLIVSISIPVGARYFDIEAPRGVIRFYEDCIGIKMPHRDDKGTDALALPEMFYSDEIEIFDYTEENIDNLQKTQFRFTYDDINGAVVIYKEDEVTADIAQKAESTTNCECIQVTQVNGIDVLVISKYDGNDSIISYYCGNIYCSIAIKCDFDTAKEIAKTLTIGENFNAKINN